MHERQDNSPSTKPASLKRRTPDPFIGQHIAHYTVLEKLGEGAMGVVDKARDEKPDRPPIRHRSGGWKKRRQRLRMRLS